MRSYLEIKQRNSKLNQYDDNVVDTQKGNNRGEREGEVDNNRHNYRKEFL